MNLTIDRALVQEMLSHQKHAVVAHICVPSLSIDNAAGHASWTCSGPKTAEVADGFLASSIVAINANSLQDDSQTPPTLCNRGKATILASASTWRSQPRSHSNSRTRAYGSLALHTREREKVLAGAEGHETALPCVESGACSITDGLYEHACG
eukprot:6157564-Pleurochrysis_carterae.AAC.3